MTYFDEDEEVCKIRSSDASAFSFVDVAASFIQNASFYGGFKQFQNAESQDSHEAFIYKVLSAASGDIGQTIYDNVKRYISYVSDVDVCKVKALKSILNLFGFNYTIFDKLNEIPLEVLQLIDMLSISRKFLIKDGWFTQDFLDALSSSGVITGDVLEDSLLDIRHLFKRNAYALNTCCCLSSTTEIDARKLGGIYQQLDSLSVLELSSIVDESALSSTDVFVNNYGYLMVDQASSYNIYSPDLHLVLKFPGEEINALSSAGLSASFAISSLSRVDDDLSSSEFIKLNGQFGLDVRFVSLFREDVKTFSDDAYEAFVENMFERMLSGYVTLPYNLEFLKDKNLCQVPIYPDLGSDYYKSFTSLRDWKSFGEDELLSTKAFYHIPASFDQRTIVDQIEIGDDELDNYSGVELSILQFEIDRRNAQLQLSSLASRGYSGTSATLLRTRGSYYRKKKVLEIAKFVDDYFSQTHKSPTPYELDPNFYVVSSDASQISTVISRTPVGKPSIDINAQMIKDVALHLAKLTTYIQKTREKIKQQTQKNYMKGTNLLLIYIINEYLIDYAKHNEVQLFEDGLSGIFQKLSAHQFKESEDTENYTINPVEFYDETNYFNISASTSSKTALSTSVAKRYWESSNDQSKGLLKDDGLYFSAEEIERFYLSTLNLNSALSGNLPTFLSSIFDLGADPTFIFNLSNDSSLSIFSSALSNGQFASEIYEELIQLSSAWRSYKDDLDDQYEYDPVLSVGGQLSDSVEVGIFTGLSAKHLSAVSAVYDRNYPNVKSLSAEVRTLSSSYGSFISSDYSFYYKKFESKYCYEDFDVDLVNGYKHNWYIGNDKYDLLEMSLYEHLFQLDKYSTEDNIVNWALSDIIVYVEDGFNSVYGSLRSDVISKIKDYGFIDINALTLDDELDHTYTFLNDLITSRKQFLKEQLASLQQQASTLKTQYDSLNNTFTTAVASFNDGSAGYNLGNNTIYAVSINTCPSNKIFENQRCTRASSKPSSKAYLFCINIEGYWYYCSSSEHDSGSYAFEKQDISPKYDPNDPLVDRCKAVKAYMSTMTHFVISNYDSETESYDIQPYYGFQNEGIAAVADNTEAALANMQSTYDTICGMASTMFGISISSPSADLYQNILDLIEKLVAIDETFFDSDGIITEYAGYLKKVISLSSLYIPIKEAFDSIFKSTELGMYMMNLIPMSDLTYDNIQEVKRYRRKTDVKNLTEIRAKIKEFFIQFDQLLSKKNAIELSVYNDGVSSITFTTGNLIEQYIYQLNQTLLDDVDQKITRGNALIDLNKQRVLANVSIISSEVSSSLSSIDDLDNVVSARIGHLNFFEHDNYKKYRELFLTYGGRNFCYDPYYNLKNQTHPSYQIHPYLWNFVRKLDGDTLIQTGFQSNIVNELEEDQVNSYLRRYINDYGMPVDLWHNANKGLVDYTGYLSRYEMSENYSQSTGLQNEVVDYDGGFYPPALDEFTKSRQTAINSVSSLATKLKCLEIAEDTLPDVLSSKVELSVAEDSESSLVISKETLYLGIADVLSSVAPITASSVKKVLDAALVGHPLSVLSKNTVSDALREAIPQTFFEKYYKHLDLPVSECQRIAHQLAEYGDRIVELTKPTARELVYDIYKYGLDLNGNSYILYKQYDYSKVEEARDLTFSMKRDTPGEIWIRLASHPIAFPAFSGKNPAYYLKKPSQVNMSILSVAATEDPNAIVWLDDDHTEISEISSKMQVVYDFETSKNRSSIAYVMLNGDYDNSSIYRRFELGWVVGSRVQTYYDQITDIEWLEILNDGGSGIERIDFNYNSSLGQHYIGIDALIQTSMVAYPALVGCYPLDDAAIDFVYLEKNYSLVSSDGSELSGLSSSIAAYPEMFAVKIQDGTSYKKTSVQNVTQLENIGQMIVGDTTCVGYDKDTQQVALAVTTRTVVSSPDLLETCTTSGEVDFEANCEGPTIADPLDHDMNSHDYFAQNVTIAKFKRKSASFQFKTAAVHNINADISYIPSYPSLSNETKIYAKWPDEEWYNIELLGRARDLDDEAKLVNPRPNPYLDYEAIVEDTAFGRVYEDYQADEDKTFRLVTNPSLHPNSPTQASYSGANKDLQVSYHAGDDCLQYQILLAKLQKVSGGKYTEHDYQNLKILVYNKMTLGKNPYLIADLKSLASGKEVELAYDEDQSAQLGEIQVLVPETERNEYYAVGTHNSFSLKTKSDSNHFKNISRITAQLDLESSLKPLTFKFYIEDKAFPFQIPTGAFSVLLHNPNDLTMFKYYHLFDAYGVVNCSYFATHPEALGQPDDGRGWGIYYDMSKLSADPRFKDQDASYFEDDSGLVTWLRDIELSAYDHLSDIYVLSGYKNLGFKYDEELRFATSSDLYYYPTMNLSYPKQAADYVQAGKLVSKSSVGELSVLQKIFNHTNLFVVDLADPVEIADKIGEVAVPVMVNVVDDVRAFEDWLDTSSFISTYIQDGVEVSSTVELKMSEIYSPDDPRVMAWVRFASDAYSAGAELTSRGYMKNQLVSGTTMEEPFEVDLSAWDHTTDDEFVSWTQIKHNLVPMTSEELTSDFQSEYVFVDVNSETADLARMLKLYINYKKDPETNTIDLYFNYFNWFNSPYVSIEDNQMFIDTIDGTYLKLKSGEDGLLDIIVQIKYYNGADLCGYKNIKVLGYHIWNISDDKPKFLIQKNYEIQRDSCGIDVGTPKVVINLQSLDVNLDALSMTSYPETPIWLTIACNTVLSGEGEFYINYPGDVLEVQEAASGFLSADNDTGIVGLSKIHIFNTDVKVYKIPFKSKLKVNELAAKYRNSGINVSIDEPLFLDKDGSSCELTYNDCSITFKTSSQIALSTKKDGAGSLVLEGTFVPERVILAQNG